jgi:hypothetical protein
MLTSKGNVTVLLLTTGGMWWRLSLTERTTDVTRDSTAVRSRAWRTAAADKGGWFGLGWWQGVVRLVGWLEV